jgi:hypothetical protein
VGNGEAGLPGRVDWRLDENNVHRFHHALTRQFFNMTWLTTEQLLEYDQNNVGHTQALNERRITPGEGPIVWKYIQYLAFLFTEVYLDWYFTKPDELRKALKARAAKFNDSVTEADRVGRDQPQPHLADHSNQQHRVPSHRRRRPVHAAEVRGRGRPRRHDPQGGFEG